MAKTTGSKLDMPSEAITQFAVSEDGTLQLVGFKDAETRAEFYDSAGQWEQSPQDLADAMQECPPLAWEVQSIYSDVRDELQAAIGHARDGDEPDNERRCLEAQLLAMPEEPEEGASEWLLQIDEAYFKSSIVERIRKWFASPPDWRWEEDYLPDTATAQGAASAHFWSWDIDTLDALGVEIVEGDHPGSTYYAAELRGSVEEANAAAVAAKLPVRFILLSDAK